MVNSCQMMHIHVETPDVYHFFEFAFFSARRLAQGRQRLLKRGSPSNTAPQSLEASSKTRPSLR